MSARLEWVPTNRDGHVWALRDREGDSCGAVVRLGVDIFERNASVFWKGYRPDGSAMGFKCPRKAARWVEGS